MTSEGHYAGSQPADATSGGSSSDGFPPDADGQRNAGRASAQPPADGFPSSYAPPPQATPNGGSPFVVPVVGQRSSGTSYGSARVPAPSPDELPQRNGASPYGSVSPFPPADSAPAEQPPSAWAPPPSPPRAELPQRNSSTSADAPPLPQRNPTTPPQLVEFDGFAAAGGAPSPAPEPNARPAGLSAFGDQRVRVPGATLTGLPDAPPPRPAGRDELDQQGSGFLLRGGGNGTVPTRRGDSGGFPLRSPAGLEGESGDAPPANDLPIRSRTGYAPSGPSGFNGFGGAASAPTPSPSPSPSDDAPHPYARAVPDQPARPASDDQSFGRSSGPSVDGPASPFAASPFGASAREDEHAPFRRPAAPAAETPAGGPAANGYPRRVPGAALGAVGLNGFGPASSDSPAVSDPASVSGSPSGASSVPASFGAPDSPFGSADSRFDAPDSRFGAAAASSYGSAADDSDDGSVPQPRDAAERPASGTVPPAFGSPAAGSPAFGSPAVGSARPVTASASVPSASRVAPIDASELPPPAAAPQARVYGRPASAAPQTDDDEPSGRHDEDQRPAGAYGSPAFPAPQGRSAGTYGSASPVADRNDFFPSDDPAAPASGRENGDYGAAAYTSQPQGGDNPFGASAQGGNPFGAGAPGDNPFGASAQGSSPFGERDDDQGDSGALGAPAPFSARRDFSSQPDHSTQRDYSGQPDFSGQPDHSAQRDFSGQRDYSGQPDGFSGQRDGGQGGSGPFGSPALPDARDGDRGSAGFPEQAGPPPFVGHRDGGRAESGPFGSPTFPGAREDDQGGSAAAPGRESDSNPFGRPGPRREDDPNPFGRPAFPGARRGDAHSNDDQAGPGPFGAPGARDAEQGDSPAFRGAGPGPFGSPAFPVARDAEQDGSSPFAGGRDGGPGSVFGSSTFPGARDGGQSVSSAFPSRDGGPGDPPGFPDQAAGARDGDQGGSAPFGNDQNGQTGFPPGAYGNRVSNDESGDRPATPGVAPQSPARATARASASARVAPPAAPPEQPDRSGPAFGDLIGGSQNGAPASPYAPEQFSELTTDVAGRDRQPYVPAPALVPFPPEASQPASAPPQYPQGGQTQFSQGGQTQFPQGGQAQVAPSGQAQFPQGNQQEFGPGGQQQVDQTMLQSAFPPGDGGPAMRATVTPPTPEDTTSWPGVEAGEGKFDQFKPDTAPAKPETPHVRMLPVLIAVVVGAGLLVGLAFGIVYLVAGHNGGSSSNSSFSVSTGDCVKKSGDAAVKAGCGDAGSYKVTAIVDDKSKCADQQQPYVLNPTSDGKTQVLCLKPNS